VMTTLSIVSGGGGGGDEGEGGDGREGGNVDDAASCGCWRIARACACANSRRPAYKRGVVSVGYPPTSAI